MRLVFMGTPQYAAICLQALLDAGHQVVGLFTQPDRPKGRGGKVSMPETKQLALQAGIPVFQPARISRDGLADLKSLAPDLCVTAAYGQILSEEILAVPRLGTVNVHASLLPAYRGSSPANWVIIKGESTTGVTTMMTDKGIDTGDILLQQPLAILPRETAGELTLRLAQAGAVLLLETLEKIQQGRCPRSRQDESSSSYYPMLRRETGELNWYLPAVQLENLVRGVNPWPGASSSSPWGRLKVIEVAAEQSDKQEPPGSILEADAKAGLLVQTGQGGLRIMRLQAAGGKAMDSRDFLRGHPLDQPGTMNTEEVEA